MQVVCVKNFKKEHLLSSFNSSNIRPAISMQILWPDGIFLTKHPRRQCAPSSSSPSQASPRRPQSPEISSPRLSDEQQQLEAERRAKFVYELMIGNFVYHECFLLITCIKLKIFNLKKVNELDFLDSDNAPAAIVSLVGRKEYEQCAKDLYFFIQVI